MFDGRKFWIQIDPLIESILKINMQLRPEVFLLGQREGGESHGTLFLWMIIAAILKYFMHRDGKNEHCSQRVLKMMELAEMAMLTSLIREKTLSTFRADKKPLAGFLHKTI